MISNLKFLMLIFKKVLAGGKLYLSAGHYNGMNIDYKLETLIVVFNLRGNVNLMAARELPLQVNIRNGWGNNNLVNEWWV